MMTNEQALEILQHAVNDLLRRQQDASVAFGAKNTFEVALQTLTNLVQQSRQRHDEEEA